MCMAPRMQGKLGDRHIDIACEVLPERDLAPGNDQNAYVQMFNLKFARILEQVVQSVFGAEAVAYVTD